MGPDSILILVIAAMIAQKPAPACKAIIGAKPVLPDIALNDPSMLSSADKSALTALAGFMRQHNCGVVIQGFTDLQGKDRQHDQLRAKTVMDFLTRELPEAQRVRLNQVTTEAKGVPSPTKRQPQIKFARVIV